MTEPRIIVTAGAIIRDDLGRILLQKRSDYGDWGLPGGAMEYGETIEETMLREVYEETGLQLKNYSFYAVYSGPRMKYIYPDGNQVAFVMFLYESHYDFAGRLKSDSLLFSDENGESLALRLFELDDITPEILNVVQLPVFEDIAKNERKTVRS